MIFNFFTKFTSFYKAAVLIAATQAGKSGPAVLDVQTPNDINNPDNQLNGYWPVTNCPGNNKCSDWKIKQKTGWENSDAVQDRVRKPN